MPFAAPPADVPYAYVVDYRPLDACAPPACRLQGSDLLGWWDEIQEDGGRGTYTRFGEPNTELYYRRAKVVRAGKAFEFELSAAPGEFEYDGYFAAAVPGNWKADIEVARADGGVLWRQAFEGDTRRFKRARRPKQMARYDEYFQHVRVPLPARAAPLRVRIRNVGAGPLSIGSPLVLRKEPGRRPRQAVVVVIDAVPEPLLTRMFNGSGDCQTAWLADVVREQGTLFSKGVSPGFNSPTFIRRFFRSGFYETQGEPALLGQGIDEQAPASPPSPLTRLAEQGFQLEASMGNFMLLPTQTRLGFDGGYHNAHQAVPLLHPEAVARRFAQWLERHAHDDALHVIWFATTHAPYPPGRDAPPIELNAPGLAHEQRMLNQIWRNLLDAVDHVSELRQSARAVAPAHRIWLLTTDHGKVFTEHSMGQPTWLAASKQISDRGSWHCCLGSFEETDAPFAVLYDGAARVTPPRVEEPTSTVAFWRLLERSFGVQLELPSTSSYEVSGLMAEREGEMSWQEGLLASVGDSGSIRAVHDRWAYRSLMSYPRLVPLFDRPDQTQRALTGSPNRGDYFLAEELYDRSRDPYELQNVADGQEQTVLEFRRKLADWLAVYYDPPNHPRYEYVLEFPVPVELTLSAPRPVRVSVDGAAAPPAPVRRMSLRGKRFLVHAEDAPASVVDLEGLELSGLVRCAATGLPLEELSGQRVRLNLALARTNCVGSEDSAALGPNDVGFRARLVREARISSGGGMTQELLDGLRSWGYVRDLDQAHGSQPR